MKNFIEKEKVKLSKELSKLNEMKEKYNSFKTYSIYTKLRKQKQNIKTILFRIRNYKNIFELIEQAKTELVEETFSLLKLDQKIKTIFKTEDSLFRKFSSWQIQYSDTLCITCPIHALNEYVICITFFIKKFRFARMSENIPVTVSNILLTDRKNC
ncbi:MAG: hypothetical protein HFJ26_01825 [Clostridia bacterium]|nr:hypothetical protein [Clostridia bacterium]